MVSSEFAPVASTGELGDAVGALGRGLARRGHEIVVVLPDYGATELRSPSEYEVPVGDLGEIPTTAGPRTMSAWLTHTPHTGLRVVRLTCPALYDRPGYYGTPEDFGDNPDRFWALAVGAMAAARRLRLEPDIVHSHDWHAGWLPLVIKTGSDFQASRTVHTGYDLRMAGAAPLDWGAQLGLVPALLNPDGVEYFGRISFAKVGLRFAEWVAMSTPQACEPAEGLAGVVRVRGASVVRIPRSVDAAARDPARDLSLPAHFCSTSLQGKQTCKRRLQAAMGFEISSQAVVMLVPEDPGSEQAKTSTPEAPVQWLPLEGLSDGLLRLAYAGADALWDPSGDPWSACARLAERYGVALVTPAPGELRPGVDLPEGAYPYDPRRPEERIEAIRRLVADHSNPSQWQDALRKRLAVDPERGIEQYEQLYRQALARPPGPAGPWATRPLLERLKRLGG